MYGGVVLAFETVGDEVLRQGFDCAVALDEDTVLVTVGQPALLDVYGGGIHPFRIACHVHEIEVGESSVDLAAGEVDVDRILPALFAVDEFDCVAAALCGGFACMECAVVKRDVLVGTFHLQTGDTLDGIAEHKVAERPVHCVFQNEGRTIRTVVDGDCDTIIRYEGNGVAAVAARYAVNDHQLFDRMAHADGEGDGSGDAAGLHSLKGFADI